MSNKIELSGIFSDGYGINPKKLWKLKIGIYKLKNGKKIKGIYVKSVLSYMLSHTGSGNSCFPSINTISEDLEISKDIIINAINAAVEMDMISKEQMYPDDPLKHNNKYILNFMSNNTNYDVRHSRITCSTGTNFEVVTVEQNNNSINNNSINNNKAVYEIIDYLNQKANKKFTHTNKSFNKHITARINDGFTIDQMKTVIDYKCQDKYFLDNPQYLNPDTLFRPSNFEKYLNSMPTKKECQDELTEIKEVECKNTYLQDVLDSASDEQNDVIF